VELMILPMLHASHTQRSPQTCGALWDRHGQLLEALHAWNCFQAPRSGVTLLIVIMDQSTSFCLSKT
jgi:hypothetical protein